MNLPTQHPVDNRPPRILKTDVGNAQRLARDFGADLHYVEQWNKWLVWDGRRWSLRQGEAQALAKRNAIALLTEAAATTDDRERRELVAHAEASQSASRIRAALFLAQSEPGIAIEVAQLDAEPWLLNCENGVVDLRTGALHTHRRADLLTKLCPTSYVRDAECPKWLAFLNDVFEGDGQLILYVQKLLGYFLTGTVSEQILPIFWGSGANGKSTLVNVLLEVLGPDFAMKAPRNLLTDRSGKSEHSTDLTDLFGKRFVAASETDDGRRFSEALVKDLTGSEPIRARRMREDNWQFDPTFKPVLSTNHRPQVIGTDNAIWRRLVMIPFMRTFTPEQQDKNLADKLRAEYPGILGWCVRGCLQWQAEGLAPPIAVTAATQSYRAEQDAVGTFLTDCCVISPDAKAKAADLYAAYRSWCEESGEEPLTVRQFGQRMTDRGFKRHRSNGINYQGVGMKLERWNLVEPTSL